MEGGVAGMGRASFDNVILFAKRRKPFPLKSKKRSPLPLGKELTHLGVLMPDGKEIVLDAKYANKNNPAL